MFENLKMRENCGKLIKYYREQCNKNMKSQEFLCCNFILTTPTHHFFEIATGQPVCSKATLNRLERGKSTKDDELYGFFIRKLGYEAHDDFKLTESLGIIYPNLFAAADFYLVEELEKLENEVEILFNDKKDWFYYREIYTALKITFDYYLRAVYPTKQEADRLLEIHFVLDTRLDEILLTILFEFYYNIQLNIRNAEQVANYLSKSENTMISKIALSHWCNYKERFMDSLHYIEEALEYYRGKSDYREGLFYYAKASILHSVNRSDIFDYFNLAMEYMERVSGKLAEDKTIKIYYNIGYHYFSLKSYERSLFYFSKFLERPRQFSTHYLFILSTAEICGITNLKEKFATVLPLPDENKSFSFCFYNYFVMKINKEDPYIIQKYIMSDIYIMLKSQYCTKDIFEYFKSELSNIVRVTKRYKCLGIFEELTSHKDD